MVHICIPPNILNGFAPERKFGKESALFVMKTFFFFFLFIWSSSEFGGKKYSIFDKDFFFFFFWSSPEFGEKKCSICIFFFGLHYISTPEQNRGRGSSPPTLKIGQNWGKIANYPPPNAQQRSASLTLTLDTPLILPSLLFQHKKAHDSV